MNFEPEANFGHAKAGCYQCMSPNAGVAFDASIEGEGGLYLCRACLIDAVRLIDWERDKHMVEENAGLRAEIEMLQQELDEQGKLVATLKKSWDLHKAREARSGKRSGDRGLGGLGSSDDGGVADGEEGPRGLRQVDGGAAGSADGPADESQPGAVSGGADLAEFPLSPA